MYSEDDASSLGSTLPTLDEDHDDDISWPSICSHHGSRYPCCEAFTTRNEQGVPLWDISRGLSMCRIYPGLWHGFIGNQKGVSLSLRNGGIFPNDDITNEFRSILEWEHEVESKSGSDWKSSFHISAVLNESPTGPLYTLMLIVRHTWLRSGEVSVLFGDHSSDEDYSLSGDTY